MAVYLDTSALVKLYAEEEKRGIVFEAVDSSDVVATSTVAYTEARAALARRLRESKMGEELIPSGGRYSAACTSRERARLYVPLS